MKVIQVAFFSVLMWFLVFFTVGATTVPWFGAVAGVVAVVGVWGVGIYKAVEEGQRIERLRVEMEQARQHAEEAQAEADRLAEEARVANEEAERARQRMEARAALMEFVNPN